MKENLSTTEIDPRLQQAAAVAIAAAVAAEPQDAEPLDAELPQSIIEAGLTAHQQTFAKLDTAALSAFCAACIKALSAGGKILIFGNGGSAADAQHFAAELTGRYLSERRALAAIALSTDTSALTAIANDYGYERVFARQVQALARPGDLCVGISTSGSSPNVLAAFKQAQALGADCWLLSGEKCAAAPAGVGLLRAASSQTPRIQEAHIFFIHTACEMIDYAVENGLICEDCSGQKSANAASGSKNV